MGVQLFPLLYKSCFLKLEYLLIDGSTNTIDIFKIIPAVKFFFTHFGNNLSSLQIGSFFKGMGFLFSQVIELAD